MSNLFSPSSAATSALFSLPLRLALPQPGVGSNTCTCTQLVARTQQHLHTYTHIQTHTYIHTYIHTERERERERQTDALTYIFAHLPGCLFTYPLGHSVTPHSYTLPLPQEAEFADIDLCQAVLYHWDHVDTESDALISFEDFWLLCSQLNSIPDEGEKTAEFTREQSDDIFTRLDCDGDMVVTYDDLVSHLPALLVEKNIYLPTLYTDLLCHIAGLKGKGIRAGEFWKQVVAHLEAQTDIVRKKDKRPEWAALGKRTDLKPIRKKIHRLYKIVSDQTWRQLTVADSNKDFDLSVEEFTTILQVYEKDVKACELALQVVFRLLDRDNSNATTRKVG